MSPFIIEQNIYTKRNTKYDFRGLIFCGIELTFSNKNNINNTETTFLIDIGPNTLNVPPQRSARIIIANQTRLELL